MKRIHSNLLCMLVLYGISSAPSDAQTDVAISNATDPWYLMPELGVFRPDSMFGVSDHGQAFGLTLGKPVSKNWDLQIYTKYGRKRGDGLTYQQNMLGVDGLYMFSRDHLRPFLLLGAGYQRDRLSADGYAESGYAPYVTAGLGAQVHLDRNWAWQVDFRRVQGFLKGDHFSSNRDRNNYVSLGMSYAFD